MATRTHLADETRTVPSRERSINANLRSRTDDKIAIARRIDGELAGIAERVARQTDVVRNARRKLRALGDQASGLARAAVAQLERTAVFTRKIAAQTGRDWPATTTRRATRIVSLHDRPAIRPRADARAGDPTDQTSNRARATSGNR